MTHGLEASGVVVRFRGLVSLDGVNGTAEPGRVTGLIRPNGAGKTTLFRVICGFQHAHKGRVTLDGFYIDNESPARRAVLGMGRTFQRMELLRSLTARENVALAAESCLVADDPLSQLGLPRGGRKVKSEVTRTTTDELIEATELGPVADRLAGEIPLGRAPRRAGESHCPKTLASSCSTSRRQGWT